MSRGGGGGRQPAWVHAHRKDFQYQIASLPFYWAGNRNSCRAKGSWKVITRHFVDSKITTADSATTGVRWTWGLAMERVNFCLERALESLVWKQIFVNGKADGTCCSQCYLTLWNQRFSYTTFENPLYSLKVTVYIKMTKQLVLIRKQLRFVL